MPVDGPLDDDEKLLVQIPVGADAIEGNLTIPPEARGIALFAHGAGSSRHSSRNNFVAEVLRNGSLGTLLIDLLTPEEKAIDRRTRLLRFDIDRLKRRVVLAVEWLAAQPRTSAMPLGIYGSSTGAAGALFAAADRPDEVKAIVSRGGRVDLADPALAQVKAPCLFIVGGQDLYVLDLNRAALAKLNNESQMEIIRGAGQLFEEEGAMEEVARLSREWFLEHL